MKTACVLCCQAYETGLLSQLRELCHIAGISLQVKTPVQLCEENPEPPVTPGLGLGGTVPEYLYRPIPEGPCEAPFAAGYPGANRSMYEPVQVITQAAVRTLQDLPQPSPIWEEDWILVLDQDEFLQTGWFGTILRLPQDGEQMLTVLSFNERGKDFWYRLKIQVAALADPTLALLVAVGLAEQMARHVDSVCLIDRTDQAWPLVQMLGAHCTLESAEKDGAGRDTTTAVGWHSFEKRGLLVPARLQNSLPRWRNVGVLAHNGQTCHLGNDRARLVSRTLDRAYPVQISVVGPTAPPNCEDRCVWVLPTTTAAALAAWGNLSEAAVARTHVLTVSSPGSLPPRQFTGQLENLHPHVLSHANVYLPAKVRKRFETAEAGQWKIPSTWAKALTRTLKQCAGLERLDRFTTKQPNPLRDLVWS